MKVTDFFANPSALGIGLAIIFGIIWLIPLAPLKLNRIPTWLVFLAGAVVFVPCIVYIQVPLQNLVGNGLITWLGVNTYIKDLFFTAIPVILLSGLVQEGAKLIPTTIYWIWRGREINPVLGLSLGAMAGAGFGIIEAQWVNDMILASGWNWGLVQSAGVVALAGFWERFFTVCFHISVGALAGWGLARGWGWQFYLIASVAHSIANYSAVLAQNKVLSVVMIEVFVAICAAISFGIVFWLRWRKIKVQNEYDQSSEIKFY